MRFVKGNRLVVCAIWESLEMNLQGILGEHPEAPQQEI